MQHLSLYLDHPKVGCGWRSYIVIQRGPKWARLISTETAEAFKVPSKLVDHGRPLPVKRTRMARRLRAVAQTYGMDKSASVRDALRLLRAA